METKINTTQVQTEYAVRAYFRGKRHGFVTLTEDAGKSIDIHLGQDYRISRYKRTLWETEDAAHLVMTEVMNDLKGSWGAEHMTFEVVEVID